MGQQLSYKTFIIKILEDTRNSFSLSDSTSNSSDCYSSENSDGFVLTKYLLQTTNISEKIVKQVCIAGTGAITRIHERSCVLSNDQVTICCGNTVFSLTLPDLKLRWKTKADDASCFGIFQYKNDYILHGELAISKLDNTGNILWQFLSDDIFTTTSGKDNFKIEDNYIHVTNWNNILFKLNAETGQQLESISG